MSESASTSVEDYARVFSDLVSEVGKVIVGQEEMISRLLIACFRVDMFFSRAYLDWRRR